MRRKRGGAANMVVDEYSLENISKEPPDPRWLRQEYETISKQMLEKVHKRLH